MATTITWSVVQFDVAPSMDGLTDVVKAIHWSANGTDGTDTGSSFGIVALAPADPSQYTPYENITQAEAVQWVKTALGPVQVAKYETVIQNQIDAAKNPPIINPPLPWG